MHRQDPSTRRETSMDTEAVDGQFTDCRRAERHQYSTAGLAAPCFDGELPTASMFHEVRFHDLSISGVSFIVRIPPTFKQVVVRVGQPPDDNCLLADVVRWRPVDDQMTEYLVGCRFVSKVEILFL